MKKLIVLAIATLFSGSLLAQTTATTSPLKFGLKAGVNFPKYSYHADDAENPETESTTNFHVTGYLDAPLGGILSIQPALSLQGKGGKSENQMGQISEQNTMWLEVPVNLVGRIPVAGATHIFLGAGPYAAVGISGENKVSSGGSTIKTDVEFGDSEGDDLKQVDLGLNFMGGVQLGNGFNLGAGYGLGLNDLRPGAEGGEGKVTNRVWSFSVGFAF